jgi:8-oxo-dGTP pyrophosphatase MutT (NUDIX family)
MRKPYVLGFIVCLESNEVLLIEKTKPQWQAGYLNGIGGKVEMVAENYYEKAHAAMAREAYEECGLRIGEDRWIYFADMQSENWIVWCFVAVVDHHTFKEAETQEAEKIKVINLHNIHWQNGALLGNIAWLINMGLDAYHNGGSFEPPSVEYHSFSFPLSMIPEEKARRTEVEHQIEKK